MGFLPIFIALFGLILLYSLFTYNQIKPKKAAWNLVIDEMAKLSRNRKDIILNHDRQHENSPLSEVAKELMKTSTDRFQSFRKENELIAKTNEAATSLGTEHQGLKDEIMSLNKSQEANLQKLESKTGQYNAFIQKSPTKVIASVFGFRPF